ncbi:MAG: nucleoside triphosphate pyrophosphohydrolase [Clostridia bacterium]
MFTIVIAPLSTPATITAAAWNAIRSTERLFLQTDRHPSAQMIVSEGLSYTTMDDLYESAADYDALNGAIAARLADVGDCVYAVTGHIRDTQLPAILHAVHARGGEVLTLPGIPLSRAAFPTLPEGSVYPASLLPDELNPDLPLYIEEIDSRIHAGAVKLHLFEYYPDNWEILLANMDSSGRCTSKPVLLYELDQQVAYSATTVAFVAPVPFEKRERFGYTDLCAVIRRLRAPGGCPWDRTQTHSSLKMPLLEECYELLDAIDEENDAHLTEELGDVLMQVVFHTTIAEEQARFNSRDVTTDLVQKLIFRHPHVFSNVSVHSADEVLVNWDKLKKIEKSQKTQTDVLMSVPRNLPALVRSKKVQKKAADVGFDWPSAENALPKIQEELNELATAMTDNSNISEEMGDLLFSVVNVARLLHLDPEFLLLEATDKFTARFASMEKLAAKRGYSLDQLSFDECNALWDSVKTSRNGA